MTLVFPLFPLKYRGDSGRQGSRRDYESKVLNTISKPQPQKVNDMHLIPMSPNKAGRDWFHTHISGGLSKEKKMIPSLF